MPNWITISLGDLNDARVAELIDALRNEALGVGQTDPMPRIIQDVSDEIRRCIGFWPATPVDSNPATIPTSMKNLAVEAIVRGMKGRLLQPLSDDEKDAEKLYQRRLEMLTRGEWPVDKPDTAQSTPTVQHGAPAQIVSQQRRPLTSDQLRGL